MWSAKTKLALVADVDPERFTGWHNLHQRRVGWRRDACGYGERRRYKRAG